MSERLTPQNKYFEYLRLDEDDYIDVRINDQVVKQQSVRQIQKWNREGRVCTTTGSTMNPESHKLIQQRLLRTRFQYDPQDAPRASNYIPPFSTEKNNVSQVDQTNIKFPIPRTPVVTHPIQTLDISEANFIQKTVENLIQKTLENLNQKRKRKFLRKLQEEWKEAEMDIREADNRQKTKQELCTEAEMDICVEDIIQKFMQDVFTEAEMDIREADNRQKTKQELCTEAEMDILEADNRQKTMQELCTEAEMDIREADNRRKTMLDLCREAEMDIREADNRQKTMQELCTEAEMDTATGIHDTRKEVQHKYLIEGREEEIQMAYFPKELEEGRMHTPKHLNKLDDEQNITELIMGISEADNRQKTMQELCTEAEMDISKADDRQKTLENLTQKRKPPRLRKLQELCTEAEMDDWNNPTSQLKRGQGNNAVNRRAVESSASFGPSMDGINNTQLVINGAINGTFNYAHQSGNSGMMHFVYLAVIIALLGYLMLRG